MKFKNIILIWFISSGEMSVRQGVKFITHLFNSMLPFHHRDPGLVGLLTSKNLGGNKIYYGLYDTIDSWFNINKIDICVLQINSPPPFFQL